VEAATARTDPRELVQKVERLLEEIEALPDPAAREKATGLVGALLDLYGAGLERIVGEVVARDEGELEQALLEDELVAHLLLLHGLHPMPLERRVLDALDEVRPYLDSHGGDVELLAVEDTVVRLRLRGSCSGCPSSTMTLKLAIENAIHKSAPEIEQVIAEDEPVVGASGLLQIEVASAPAAPQAAGWTMAGGLPELTGGGVVVKRIGGSPILFAAVGGRFYAYRPACPGCEESLDGAELEGTALRCVACGRRFDVIRAGRCLDSRDLHLEPVPLLVGDEGLVKIALPVGA
jgi:Fe-S cluster biogenesis protein NfuA/nitrite reductase/ring-hydroxylating ferredoxin subunit